MAFAPIDEVATNQAVTVLACASTSAAAVSGSEFDRMEKLQNTLREGDAQADALDELVRQFGDGKVSGHRLR